MAKKQNHAVTTELVGLDIGYGFTKAITPDGDSIVFPSVSGHAREIKFRADEIGVKYPGDMLTDEDGSWFIGDLAMSQLRTGEIIRLRGRTSNEQTMGNVFRVRMVKAALGKLFPGKRNGEAIHISIATGLPVDFMRDAGDLKSALIGTHRVQTDSTDFVAHITDVMVMPQPYGTIYSRMLKANGDIDECYSFQQTGVIDVGTYTVDLTLDNDGEYIDVRSGSAESGVYLVQEAIAGAYERDYRAKPNIAIVDNIIKTGCFRVNGNPVDYRHEVKEATAPLRDATLKPYFQPVAERH